MSTITTTDGTQVYYKDLKDQVNTELLAFFKA